MEKLVTGIDDIGTMGAKSEGWTFFSFSEVFQEEFEEEANRILESAKLGSFHAKDFKRKKADSYKDFLNLIRTILEEDGNSFICCTLSDQVWKSTFSKFCNNLIDGAFKTSGITDEKFIESSIKLAMPLFTYMNKSSQHVKADFTLIHLDSDSILKRLTSCNLIVNGKVIASNDIIFSALNAYRKQQFSNAPEIIRGEIHILKDEDSFLIQAADMFGNFSTAYAAKELGIKTKTNNLKANVFFDVFGDLLDSSTIHTMVELVDNEVSLKNEGVFNFTINQSSKQQLM